MNSASSCSTYRSLKCPSKLDFLEIYLSTFFGVHTFGNTSAMRVFFFWKMFEISCRFQKLKKKMEKKFFVYEISASDLVALNCLHYEGNTCHGHSMREQTVFRLCIWVREVFSNKIAFTVINDYAKVGVVQISTVLLPVPHVAHQSVLWNRIF